MASIFNSVRVGVYCVILLFSIICLSMSAHFQHVLSASDLTRFVPFAIFVCSINMVIFMILLLFSLLLRERNPVSTRIELACLGLAGIFWLALGAFLASSDAASADVECFASEIAQQPLDDSLASFHTDQYQAMYRVLTASSLLNAALVLLCFFILLGLAMRRHKNGDQHMWYAPVTSCAWLHNYAGKQQRSHSRRHPSTRRTREILPTTTAQAKGRGVIAEKRPQEPRSQPPSPPKPNGVYLTEKPPRLQSSPPQQPARQTSNSRRWQTEHIVEGGMRNPARDAERR